MNSKEGWKLVRIGDLAEVATGGTPSTKNPDYWGGDINWMSSGEVNDVFIHKTEKHITKKGLENSNANLLPVNTVVIALAGQGKTRGKVAILKTPTTCNQSLAAILPNESYDSTYVLYNLQSRYREIRSISGGEGRSGLNLRMIKNIEINLPSLEKQREIAKILGRVDELITKKEKSVALSCELKEGLMQDLLTGEVSV